MSRVKSSEHMHSVQQGIVKNQRAGTLWKGRHISSFRVNLAPLMCREVGRATMAAAVCKQHAHVLTQSRAIT